MSKKLLLLLFLFCSSEALFARNQAACWSPLWLPPTAAAALSLFPMVAAGVNSQNWDQVPIFAISGAVLGVLGSVVWGLRDCYLEPDPARYLIPPEENPPEEAAEFPSELNFDSHLLPALAPYGAVEELTLPKIRQ